MKTARLPQMTRMCRRRFIRSRSPVSSSGVTAQHPPSRAPVAASAGARQFYRGATSPSAATATVPPLAVHESDIRVSSHGCGSSGTLPRVPARPSSASSHGKQIARARLGSVDSRASAQSAGSNRSNRSQGSASGEKKRRRRSAAGRPCGRVLTVVARSLTWIVTRCCRPRPTPGCTQCSASLAPSQCSDRHARSSCDRRTDACNSAKRRPRPASSRL